MDEDLNVRADTIKLLEENTGVHFCNFAFGDSFLNTIPKAQ